MEETIDLRKEGDEETIELTREMVISGGGVESVNGKTGNVVLTTSDLENDSDYQTESEVSSAIDTAIAGKQDTLTAGDNITITDDTISATDTTYNAFIGTDGTNAGEAGLVPGPATADAGKFLKSDGTWDAVGGGPTVVQTTGTSTTDVMSQKAVTDIIGDVESALALINNGGNS